MKIIKTKKYAARIDQSLKNRIGQELNSAGLDGNGRFPESDSGVSVIWEILKKYGLVLSDVMNKDLFRGERGHKTFNIEKISREEDPFTPGEDIENSMIVYTWEELMIGKFEILVYLS